VKDPQDTMENNQNKQEKEKEMNQKVFNTRQIYNTLNKCSWFVVLSVRALETINIRSFIGQVKKMFSADTQAYPGSSMKLR